MIREWLKAVSERISNASPVAVVLTVAGAIILIGGLINYYAEGGFRSASRYPHLEAQPRAKEAKARSGAVTEVQPDKPLFDGEMYHTALRLREASDLAIGSILFAATAQDSTAAMSPEQYVKALPHSAAEILKGLERQHLFPPGFELTSQMELKSESSVLILRYRLNPCGVEVLSLPRVEGQGPGLLVRVMGDERRQDVVYYETMSLKGLQVPGEFTDSEQMIAAGWMPHVLRGQMVSESDLERARQYLATGLEKSGQP